MNNYEHVMYQEIEIFFYGDNYIYTEEGLLSD